ncbi:MAG: glycosyltransferase [Bryobacterales bacterium]|nr:glycosyltransferase [Bryobacterales bacterium]
MYFSVVVPTHNRPSELASCLEALAKQEFAGFEIVVVDDGSSMGDQVEGVVRQFSTSVPIQLYRQSRSGPAAARNFGVSKSQGTYLAFTDDDCRPAPDWLAALAAVFARHPSAAVGGHTVNLLTDNSYSAASQVLIDYLYRYYNTPGGLARFLTSNNLAAPAAGFRELGGFDSTYMRAASEDREFCSRWLQGGLTLLYEPSARVFHAHRLTFKSYWGQHFAYGRGAHRYHLTRSVRGLARPPVEPLRFYTDLLSFPVEQQCQHRFRTAALLGLSQVAHTAGFISEAIRPQRKPSRSQVPEWSIK